MLDLISEKRALYLRCTKPARFNRNRDIILVIVCLIALASHCEMITQFLLVPITQFLIT